MLRRFFFFSSLTLVIASFIFFAFWIHFLVTPIVTQSGGIRLQLRPGTSLKTFSENLAQQGLIKNRFFFTVLARLRGNTRELKAGIYLVPQGTTPYRLLSQITNGRGLLYHVFTIIPGWTFQQMRTALAHEATLQHTIQNISDNDIMKQLDNPNLSPEGEFFPDSYYYIEGTSDIKLLSRAFKRMQMKLQEAWLKRDPHLPFQTPYDALIAASLVEKEANLSSERPVIAGVLINRLQNKMLIQFDPTIVYSLGPHFTGSIRKQDLQKDTPYNTYLHKGLPPTPIAMPSMSAFNATLHPVHHHYFYFVATRNGGHQFSQTLEEHHLAVMMQHYHEHEFFNYMLIKNYLLQQFFHLYIIPKDLT